MEFVYQEQIITSGWELKYGFSTSWLDVNLSYNTNFWYERTIVESITKPVSICRNWFKMAANE